MDWTFYDYKLGEMASMKTSPNEEKAVLDEDPAPDTLAWCAAHGVDRVRDLDRTFHRTLSP